MGKKALGVAAVAAGVVAGVGAAACALAAPRRSAEVDERWREFCRYRYAHRGLHTAGVPENSIAAFKAARREGYGVELDVHLTLDGELVVIHDSDTSRVCGRAGVVEQKSLAELGEYRLMGTDECIPTLDEVLDVFDPAFGASEGYPAAAPLIVEIKPTADNVALLTEKTLACLERHNVRFCVESFRPEVLAWLRTHRPDIIRGQLAENFLADTGHEVSLSWPMRLGGTALLGNVLGRPDFIAYKFSDRAVLPVRLACDVLGGHLVTWTVRSEADLLASEAEGSPVIFEGFLPGPESTIA